MAKSTMPLWFAGMLMLLLPVSSVQAGEVFGDGVGDVAEVRISELVNHPERYVDRRVKITGLVDDVCPMKGCWVDILDKGSRETIRFKVQDDVIVFPVEARGSEIVAEGILRRHQLDREGAVRWFGHLAEEKGEPFDPDTVRGPIDFYQIEGTGAVIGS